MKAGQEKVGLQFLRGICALGVVIDHAAGMTASQKYFGKNFLNGYLTNGAFGVDIFFVISGYIITISSLAEQEITPLMSRADFFRKRFVRIVPLMWVSILSYALLRRMGTDTHVEIQSYINAFFLIPHGDVDPNQIWTLRNEAIFYLLFSLSFLGQRGSRLFLYLWFFSPIVHFVYVTWAQSPIVKDSTSAILFDPVNIEFAMGFAFGVWSLKHPGLPNFRLPIHPLLVLLLLSITVFGIGGLFVVQIDRLFVKLIVGAFATSVVIFAAYVYCPPGRWTWLGEILGAASYSIYLFHSHFESALLAILTKTAHWLPAGVVIFVVSCGATILSLGVYLFVEKPLLKSMRRLIQRRPPAPRMN